jgi:hypothetical protein
MGAEMREWCAACLRRLNGSGDITLMQFCMSLQSAGEIREYLSEYLGSSAAVTNFASDFIKYKDTGKKPMEQLASGPGKGVPSSNSNSGFISASKKKKIAPK